MTICLSVVLSVYLSAGLNKYYWLELNENRITCNLITVELVYGYWFNFDLNFKRDLNHHLDAKKKIQIFPFTFYYVSWWRSALFECSG